jgi:hypothetical protein
MVLTVSFVISLVIGLFCHHTPRNAKHCRERTSASRDQDHTTSPSVPARFVLAHRKRPSQPAPNVRDDREAPLLEERGPAETSGGDLPDGTRKIAWRCRWPMRPIGTTGKSVHARQIRSSDKQMLSPFRHCERKPNGSRERAPEKRTHAKPLRVIPKGNLVT